MKPLKNTIPAILLGLLLAVFAAVPAQTTSQGDQKKKAESCCAMESCCNGESCEMKKEGTTNTEGKENCCNGESCDMKMKHDAKKHDKNAKGDCCNIKTKKNKKSA